MAQGVGWPQQPVTCAPLEYSLYAEIPCYKGFSFSNWAGSLIPMIAQLCHNSMSPSPQNLAACLRGQGFTVPDFLTVYVLPCIFLL